MSRYRPHLDWIEAQRHEMVRLLIEWARINSGTAHLDGLAQMRHRLNDCIAPFSDRVQHCPLPPRTVINPSGRKVPIPCGEALWAVRRPAAPLQSLLAIHMDTVYDTGSSFQSTTLLDDNTLRGPAVADAKGGLIVLIYSLMALERFVAETGCTNLGWSVLINADEEVGSPSSKLLFEQLAPQVDFALLFEPSLPDGRLIATRKGSGNFALIVRGRSAHAGRDFTSGRNAVVAAAELAVRLHQLNGKWPGTTINVSCIDGGTPPNIIPNVAVLRFNVRYPSRDVEPQLQAALNELVDHTSRRDGFSAELDGDFSAPPKLLTPELNLLLEDVAECGRELGLSLSWTSSGGVCDGNRLAALGVPNVDTLGVRGGEIHSDREYVLLDSLTERACLTALLLMRIADGSLPAPRRLSAPASSVP